MVEIHSNNNYEYNTDTPKSIINLAKRIQEADSIHEAEWDKLFDSDGYKSYLIYSDSLYKKEIIKSAMLIAFHPDYQMQRDSIVSLPIQLNNNFFSLLVMNNFIDLRNNLDQAEEFILTSDFADILKSADSLARLYLPDTALSLSSQLYDVKFICADPDGQVTNTSIIIDLNNTISLGEEGLIKFLAHEFHHNYRELITPSYNDVLLKQLNKLQQEGLADLIDKDLPPVSKIGLFPEMVVKFYNTDYANTPTNLKILDSLTTRYLYNKLDSAQYYGRVNNYFKFGGHTSGFYMSSLIRSELGIEVLIENCNNPVKFLQLYNQAAEQKENEYILSDEFMNYVQKL